MDRNRRLTITPLSRPTRLGYDLRGGQPAAMSALALFWPHPALAALADPIELARAQPGQIISVAAAEQEVVRRLSPVMASQGAAPASDGAHWRAMFEWPGALPELLVRPAQITEAMTSEEAADGDDIDQSAAHSRGLQAHVRLALDTINAQLQPTAGDRNELLSTLAAVAAHSPANIAYRSLSRVLSPGHRVSDAGLWKAAATLAAGLRSLFNRPDSTLLLDKLYDAAEPYWHTVLRYCADGNLQAVLNEYLHHLRSEEPTVVMDDEHLMALAGRARDAVSMRPSRYEGFDPDDPNQPIPFRSRFALRYGSKRHDLESARQPQVRRAFNSPFWPFVLITTSVGQEGIDFHWWCHAAVHWNLPANPVDFEQREGRVNRFGGHAVRRNIAACHRASAMTSQEADPWKAAYDAARDQSAYLGEFAPYWIYPGPFKVERQLINYPLSRDTAKVVALKDDLALYRLAFGQPRQEDLLDFLKRRGVDSAGTAGIDLRPDAVTPPNRIEAD
jgi:hypothetical protein